MLRVTTGSTHRNRNRSTPHHFTTINFTLLIQDILGDEWHELEFEEFNVEEITVEDFSNDLSDRVVAELGLQSFTEYFELSWRFLTPEEYINASKFTPMTYYDCANFGKECVTGQGYFLVRQIIENFQEKGENRKIKNNYFIFARCNFTSIPQRLAYNSIEVDVIFMNNTGTLKQFRMDIDLWFHYQDFYDLLMLRRTRYGIPPLFAEDELPETGIDVRFHRPRSFQILLVHREVIVEELKIMSALIGSGINKTLDNLLHELLWSGIHQDAPVQVFREYLELYALLIIPMTEELDTFKPLRHHSWKLVKDGEYVSFPNAINLVADTVQWSVRETMFSQALICTFPAWGMIRKPAYVTDDLPENRHPVTDHLLRLVRDFERIRRLH
jgi:hypothetical protein